MAIAEREKLDILAPCAGCFHFIARANSLLKEKANLRRKINELLKAVDLEYKGGVEVKHPLDVIVNEIGLEKVKESVVKPFKGLKTAPYYGCLMLKPPSICKFDNPENPQTLDKLIATLGAECVPSRDFKTRCCGGSLVLLKEDAALKLSMEILTRAREAGAQCLITACPFCHLNLDAKQADIKSKYDMNLDIPILYFTQFLGLALGISPRELGLNKIMVSPTIVLKNIA